MLNTLIIGAGQIAGGYDAPSDTAILTHAHAYREHDGFNLLGFYDINFENAEKMADKWETKAFSSLDCTQDIDVVSICTPDKFHLSSIKEALKLKPKIIFLEKPLSDNIDESKEILEISKDIPILVNYSRRFVKEFQELAQQIENGDFGEYKTGTGYYGKGFVHNGSHMVNLLNLLIGTITKIDVIDEFSDFYENDPTKTAVLSFKNESKFFMQGVDCRDYTVFELDLIFKKARIRILDSGFKIEIHKVINDEKFEGYKILKPEKALNTELNRAMYNALDNIYTFIKEGKPLKSTVQQAFEAANYE